MKSATLKEAFIKSLRDNVLNFEVVYIMGSRFLVMGLVEDDEHMKFELQALERDAPYNSLTHFVQNDLGADDITINFGYGTVFFTIYK